MSVAPFPALGRFWALGGAPAAFVRRDGELRARLERVVEIAAGSTPLAGDAAYARLLATVSLSSLLPTIETAAPTTRDEEVVRRRRELSGAAMPMNQPQRTQRNAEETDTNDKTLFSSASSAPSAVEMESTGVPSSMTRERPTATPLRAEASTRGVAPEASGTLARSVSAVRHEVDRRVRSRVESILSAVSATPARVEVVTPEPAQSTNVFELLTKTVQRVEHHIAERARRTSDRSAVPSDEPRTYRTSRPSETSRPPLAWPSVAPLNEPAEDTTPQAGLRGLAARFGAAPSSSAVRRVRAPLLVPPNATVTDWPDDQLASLLDDVARRGGVDTAEEAP
jgi:hypothetical protein